MAPGPYTKTGPTVFLSGSIDAPPTTWRSVITNQLSSYPVTILNPHREDWDSSWIDDVSFAPFVQQTNWELEGMENADVIAVFLGREAKAPISLMEMGLWARSGKVIVCCPRGFWKRGNVMLVCKKYKIDVAENIMELGEKVLAKLQERAGLKVDGQGERSGV
jgi:hypothetical protein